jgi:Cu/Ag efflux protein CusF
MTTMSRIGDSVQLKTFLWDGLAPVTGATVSVSIERVSDGYYWNGTAFQAAYVALDMTERSGNAHKEGEYIYNFTPPTVDGVEAYNWSCKYADDPTLIYVKGRIQTYRQASITLGAVTMSTEASNRISSPVPLSMFQLEEKVFSITVTDADGKAVDLSAMTLRFVVQDSNDPPSGEFKVEGGDISVSGEDDEIALVTVSAAKSATASTEFHWRLWDTVAEEVLAHGPFAIEPSVKDVT